jgi:hypothetical protein
MPVPWPVGTWCRNIWVLRLVGVPVCECGHHKRCLICTTLQTSGGGAFTGELFVCRNFRITSAQAAKDDHVRGALPHTPDLQLLRSSLSTPHT